MKKYLAVAASFLIMACLGGVYAWSIIAAELINDFGFTSTQTQIIFGTIIGVYPISMIIAGKLEKKINARYLAITGALIFSLGYLIAGWSDGNYWMIILGIGLLGGIGTGLGYLVSLTIPVRWFPERKGLVPGIAAAGFGLGAILMSAIADSILQSGKDVLDIFVFIGIVYGGVVLLFSNFIVSPERESLTQKSEKLNLLKSRFFRRLFLGMFLGTFAGLLVIGSLKMIGGQYHLDNRILILAVSLFSLANFAGRLIWGYLSDVMNSAVCVFLSLTVQSVSIFLLGSLMLTDFSFLLFAIGAGFGFGGNFVLFARKTSQHFGVERLSVIYPYVFLGYAIAGIAGPLTGGFLFDAMGSFFYPNAIAAILSLGGGLMFLLSVKKYSA